jgi:hypothetical protein
MKTCLVSLVSDQTIPNILVASHFRPDFLLFLSTAQMEEKGKSQAILEALKLLGQDYQGSYQIIIINEFDLIDLEQKFNQWQAAVSENYRFVVNLTGGTKMMSIAALDLFREYPSEMVYVPIPKNEFIIPFPKRRPRPAEPLTTRLTVEQYLCAYGLEIINRHRLPKYRQQALSRQETSRFILSAYRQLKPLLQWFSGNLRSIPQKQREKGVDFCQPDDFSEPHQEELLTRLEFVRETSFIRKSLKKDEINYLMGGWLEERLFLALQEALPPHADIQLNVIFKDRRGNQNELDVAFTLGNRLYLVECKSLEPPAREGGFTDFIYKLGALRQQFGLTPAGLLATTASEILDNAGKVKVQIEERARQFNLTLLPLLLTPNLEDFLRGKLHGS